LGDEEKSSKTISPVSPEVLKSQIKNVETRDLTDEDKKKLTELYNLALANIEKARSYATDTESFKKSRKTVPEAMEKLRNTLKEREEISPENILKDLEKTTLPELAQQQEKEKADLSAVEAKLSDISNQLVIQNTRPTIAKERLIELKRRVDATITPSNSSPLKGNLALMTQAEEWVYMTCSINAGFQKLSLYSSKLRLQKKSRRINIFWYVNLQRRMLHWARNSR
jgi:hypothetical protein